MKLPIIIALALCALFAGTTPAFAADGATHVDAKKAANLIKEKSDLVILDIRRDVEFEEGHIPKAKNIDFYSKDFADKLKGLDKTKPYLVHCASGGRSTKSLETFKSLGFEHVYHLDGGFNAWEKAGQKIDK